MAQQSRQVDLRPGSAQQRNLQEAPLEREELDVAAEVVSSHHVKNDVNAAAVCRSHQYGDKILVAIIHRPGGTQPAGHASPAIRPWQNSGAEGTSHLNSRGADTAGPPSPAVAGAQAPAFEPLIQTVKCSERPRRTSPTRAGGSIASPALHNIGRNRRRPPARRPDRRDSSAPPASLGDDAAGNLKTGNLLASGGGDFPSRCIRSGYAANATLMSTSPSPGSGTGRSIGCRTSGPPGREMATAIIWVRGRGVCSSFAHRGAAIKDDAPAAVGLEPPD